MSETQWRAACAGVWSRMAAAGYQPWMIPIIPPWGKIKPGLTIEAGKSPGLWTPYSDWTGMPRWQHSTTTAGDVAEWSAWTDCPSIGIRLGALLAFDMDIVREDDDKSRRLSTVVREHLATWAGAPHLRTRPNSVRWAAIYAAEQDALNTSKQVCRFLDASTRAVLGKLELLANGQQIVVQGVHPSGVLFDWPLRNVADLPRIDRTQIAMYFEALGAVLAPLGIIVETGRAQGLYAIDGHRMPIGDERLKARSLDALAIALRFIDNSKIADYDKWITLLAAIKGACGGQVDFFSGIVVPWCLQYPGNTPEIAFNKWESISDSALGATYVERIAREGGYTGPPLQTEFEVQPPDGPVTPAPLDDWIAPPPVNLPAIVPTTINPMRLVDTFANDALFGPQYRFCPDLGAWLVFDPDRGLWLADHGGYLTQTALMRFLEHLGQDRLITVRNAADMRTVMQGLPECRIGSEALDTNSMLLNTPGGVVDLGSEGLPLVHAPAQLMTMQTSVAPADGDCPLFIRCCLEWADDDDELAQTIFSMGASMLFGNPPGTYLLNLHGAGRNGKSLFMAIMRYILGSYMATASVATIAGYERSGSTARSDLVALHRKRVVFVPEFQDRKLNTGLVKAWTGGDGLMAREMYARAGTGTIIQPGRLVLLTNHPLEFQGDDPAMAARLRLIPWERKFDDDPTMFDRLKAEAPAILGRLISYARERQGQLFMAEAAIEATAAALDNVTPARKLARAVLKQARGDDMLTSVQLCEHIRSAGRALFEHDQAVTGLLMHENGALLGMVLKAWEGRYQRVRPREAIGSARRVVRYLGIALRDPIEVWTDD